MRINFTNYNYNYNYNYNNNYNETSKKFTNVSFGDASKFTLEYVYKKHQQYLPQRVADRIKEYLESGIKNLPTILEVHREVYKGLQEAKSLAEVKILYPEFKDISDITTIENIKAKSLDDIRKKMPLKDFTLDYLKKLYKPEKMEDIAKEYGVVSATVLKWINRKLNIEKLGRTYINLLRMSDEKENQRIADIQRKNFFSVPPEVAKMRDEKAKEARRDPECRKRWSQTMKALYANRPDIAEMSSKVGKMTWERCPEIKEALREYTINASPLEKKALTKRNTGKPLTNFEAHILGEYYRNFWELSGYRELYSKRRLEVIEELKKAEK